MPSLSALYGIRPADLADLTRREVTEYRLQLRDIHEAMTTVRAVVINGA